MKNLISKLLIIGMLFIPLGVAVSTTNCSLTAQQSAVIVEYQTLSGVVHVVDAARGVYATAFAAGKISAVLDAKVTPIYTKYQEVANLAITNARAQAVLVAAGTAPSVLPDNPYIAQLQTLINDLIVVFNTAQPTTPPLAFVKIAKNAKP